MTRQGKLDRITVRVHPDALDDLEELIEDGHYRDRSDAVRAAIENLRGVHSDALTGEQIDATSGMVDANPPDFGAASGGEK